MKELTVLLIMLILFFTLSGCSLIDKLSEDKDYICEIEYSNFINEQIYVESYRRSGETMEFTLQNGDYLYINTADKKITCTPYIDSNDN